MSIEFKLTVPSDPTIRVIQISDGRYIRSYAMTGYGQQITYSTMGHITHVQVMYGKNDGTWHSQMHSLAAYKLISLFNKLCKP